MQVFFLSGLGADRRVFEFLDLSFCEPVFIDWIPPQQNETLEHYALRIKEAFIPENATVIGLSFGGMLATEIAKYDSSVTSIAISSAKTIYELPAYFRSGKFLRLHYWVSGEVQKRFMLKMKWLFGINSMEGTKIYKEIINDCNPDFNRWAIDAILNWKNIDVPQNIVHIHGTHDKILPYKYVRCNYTVQKGEHLMIFNQASIISDILKNTIPNKRFNPSDLSSSANQFAHLYQG
jgi:pimeloyl-ACP methyl ester carboxylesterase